MSAAIQVKTEVRAEGELAHEERFKWREWVHLPQGAVTCEHATDGKCRDDDHFHAICRLPNAWQHDDIVEKAQAARARRVRLMRDEDSDPRVILEDQLDLLQDVPTEVIADELLERDFVEDYAAAITAVKERLDPDYIPEDEEEIPKLFANIDQDREEYLRQQQLPEDKRTEDFAELESTYTRYSKAVAEELERIQKPKHDHLSSLDQGELIAQVRRQRMEQAATQAYLNTYVAWQMYLGTLKSNGKRVWDSFQAMREEADRDIVAGVREAFDHLDAQFSRGELGKGE